MENNKAKIDSRGSLKGQREETASSRNIEELGFYKDLPIFLKSTVDLIDAALKTTIRDRVWPSNDKFKATSYALMKRTEAKKYVRDVFQPAGEASKAASSSGGGRSTTEKVGSVLDQITIDSIQELFEKYKNQKVDGKLSVGTIVQRWGEDSKLDSNKPFTMMLRESTLSDTMVIGIACPRDMNSRCSKSSIPFKARH